MFAIFGEYFVLIFYNQKGNTLELVLELKKYLAGIIIDIIDIQERKKILTKSQLFLQKLV